MAFLTIPHPTTVRAPVVALTRSPQLDRPPAFAGLDFAISKQARRLRPAESVSSSYGLVVHLPLLPTPPHGDAVTFSYRPESACLKGTSTPPTMHAHGRTYWRPAGAVTPHRERVAARRRSPAAATSAPVGGF